MTHGHHRVSVHGSSGIRVDPHHRRPAACPAAGLDGVANAVRVGRGGATDRKPKLAGALRIFGRFGFGEGVAGHITVRDPEFPEHFWVNPFGMSFRHIKVSDLILVDHDGNVVYGSPTGEPRRIRRSTRRSTRRGPTWSPPRTATACTARRSARSASRSTRITQDSCIFYERPHRHHRAGRRGGVRRRGRQGAGRRSSRRQGRDPPEPRPVHRRRDRRRGGVLVPHDGPLVPGATAGDGRRHADSSSRTRWPSTRATQTGYPLAGWFSFQPLWQEICRTDPDLFD